MGVGWAITYFIIFLQVFAGLVLLRAKLEPRFAARILGALFLLNAGVSAIMGLPREAAIWLASDEGAMTRAFRALDAPTGWLLLAFLCARSVHPAGRRSAVSLIVVGVLLALAEFPFHRAMVDYEHVLRAIPLYAGLGLASWTLAAGRPWERWFALALIARGLYWGTAGIIDVAQSGLGAEPHLFVNRAGLLLLELACIASAVRLVAGQEGPRSSVSLPVLVIGPAAALLETGVSLALPPEDVFRYGSVVLVNLVTLGLVRPVLVMTAVQPTSIGPVLARVALASGVATLATLVASPFDLGAAAPRTDAVTTYGFGLLVGLLAVSALEAAPALQVGRSDPDAPPSPAADARPEPGRAADAAPLTLTVGEAGRPQWQTILLALDGSCLPPGTPPFGTEALTQRGIVERTGIRASRVSTIVKELNETGSMRLDAHLPGWREKYRVVGEPELIGHYRGAVAGAPGVWVYYRLTPLGAALVSAVKTGEFRENSPVSR